MSLFTIIIYHVEQIHLIKSIIFSVENYISGFVYGKNAIAYVNRIDR